MSEIVERLRATFPVATNRTVQTITAGPVSRTVAASPFVYRNPDGPEAAALIEQQAREIARLREALFNATALIGHSVPMDTTALVAGQLLTAQGVWHQGRVALEKSNVE